MATPLPANASTWSVAEVSHFFENEAQAYIHDMPNARLPDPSNFVQHLQGNDVSGAVLLTAVDTQFLRDECGIKSLGIRAAVMHCINRLRTDSETTKAPNHQHTAQGTQQSASSTSVPQVLTPKTPPADLVHSNPSSLSKNEDARQAAARSTDEPKPKRRRLVLDQIVTSEISKPQPIASATVTIEQPKSLKVDEIFYGSTGMNREIEDLDATKNASAIRCPDITADAPAGSPPPSDERFDLENFVLVPQNCPASQSAYIWTQLRHYLQSNTTEITRNGKLALATLPYREEFVNDTQSRSITVAQFDSTGKVVAAREDAAFLHLGLALEERHTVGKGEWDFLLEKYANGQSDEIHASLHASELDMEISSSLADEVEADERQMAKLKEEKMDEKAIELLIDQEMNKISQAAQAKLLEMADQRARKIWRRMKGRKSIRDFLIQSAEKTLAMLHARLAKQKAQLLSSVDDHRQSSSRSSKEILEACKAMGPTLEDIEEQQWHISVWNEKREPPHVMKPLNPAKSVFRKHTAGHTNQKGSESFQIPQSSPSPRHEVSVEETSEAGLRDDGFIVIDDDVSPHPADPNGSDSLMSNEGSPRTLPIADAPSDDTPIVLSDVLQGATAQSVPNPTSRNESPLHSATLPPDALQLYTRDPVKREVPRLAAGHSDPFSATLADVNRWDLDTLIENNDKLRVLIKHLQIKGLRFLVKLATELRDSSTFISRLENALLELGEASTTQFKDDPTMANQAVFMFTAFLRPSAYHEGLSADDRRRMHNGKIDLHLQQFVKCLKEILSKEALFKSPPISSNRDEPINLVSSDDEDSVMRTPHKKRKRVVKESETAKESQKSALARQKEYDSTLQLIPNTPTSDTEINILRKDKDDPIFIPERIVKDIKPYQLEGVRFLWRELTADGADAQGCILAHTMGLGKTMQAITFLATVNEAARSDKSRVTRQLPTWLRLEKTKRKSLRTLVLCPPALVSNWDAEIVRWAGNTMLGCVIPITSKSPAAMRCQNIEAWARFGGVLIIGYELFRESTQFKGQDSQKLQTAEILLDEADIVVADELHLLKNPRATISVMAERIKTRSRIGLTGTPMSNDVQEIYAVVSFVAPGYLGGPTEFRANYAEPIQQGTYRESTKYEIRRSKKKLQVIRTLIDPKVHRADITVLRGDLRPKVEFVVTVQLTDEQARLYTDYVSAVLSGSANRDEISQVQLFSWLNSLSMLCNHPYIFKTHISKSSKTKNNAPVQPPPTPIYASSSTAETFVTSNPDDEFEITVQEPVHSERAIQAIASDISNHTELMLSAKTSVLFRILHLARACGDKTLIFSHSLDTLNYLQKKLQSHGFQYGRVDGNISPAARIPIIAQLETKGCDGLIISTRAGGTGLNIQAANRVVIFDFRFNPAIEQQAVGRAYRIGQKKPVFIYRLVAGGTFEANVYNRQLFKSSLSSRVVDRKNPRRAAVRTSSDWLFAPQPVPLHDLQQWRGKDSKVMDKLIDEQCPTDPTGPVPRPWICELSTMETLQEDVIDEPFTVDELRDINEEIAALGHRDHHAKNLIPSASAPGPPVPAPAMPLTSQGLPGASTATSSISQGPPSSSTPTPVISPGLPVPSTHTPLNSPGLRAHAAATPSISQDPRAPSTHTPLMSPSPHVPSSHTPLASSRLLAPHPPPYARTPRPAGSHAHPYAQTPGLAGPHSTEPAGFPAYSHVISPGYPPPVHFSPQSDTYAPQMGSGHSLWSPRPPQTSSGLWAVPGYAHQGPSASSPPTPQMRSVPSAPHGHSLPGLSAPSPRTPTSGHFPPGHSAPAPVPSTRTPPLAITRTEGPANPPQLPPASDQLSAPAPLTVTRIPTPSDAAHLTITRDEARSASAPPPAQAPPIPSTAKQTPGLPQLKRRSIMGPESSIMSPGSAVKSPGFPSDTPKFKMPRGLEPKMTETLSSRFTTPLPRTSATPSATQPLPAPNRSITPSATRPSSARDRSAPSATQPAPAPNRSAHPAAPHPPPALDRSATPPATQPPPAPNRSVTPAATHPPPSPNPSATPLSPHPPPAPNHSPTPPAPQPPRSKIPSLSQPSSPLSSTAPTPSRRSAPPLNTWQADGGDGGRAHPSF